MCQMNVLLWSTPGKSTAIPIIYTWTMFDREAVRLDSEGPSHQTRVGNGHVMQPQQRLVISLDSEFLATQISMEVFEGPNVC